MTTIQLTSILITAILATVGVRAAEDILIADFEGATYGSWTATGEAFGLGPARGTLPGQMAVSGFKGKGLVNSFHKGDATTGTLTSPEWKLRTLRCGSSTSRAPRSSMPAAAPITGPCRVSTLMVRDRR